MNFPTFTPLVLPFSIYLSINQATQSSRSIISYILLLLCLLIYLIAADTGDCMLLRPDEL